MGKLPLAGNRQKMKAPGAWSGRHLVLIAATIVTAAGIGVLAAALGGSDPGRIASDAIEAKATVLAQSTGTKSVPTGPHSSAAVPTYFDTFSFTDRTGQARDGYDEVSLLFYAAHGVGSAVDAYYYPEAPKRAVLGTSLRLGPHGLQYGLLIGSILLVLGPLLMVLDIDTVLAGIAQARARLWRRLGPKRDRSHPETRN